MKKSWTRGALLVSVHSLRVLLIGAGLIISSFFMPLLFTVDNFQVRNFLYQALEHGSGWT